MSLTMYADFSCPAYYIASRRVDALSAAGRAIDWRAVEHAPRLPVTGLRLSDADRHTLANRFAAFGDLLLPGETLPFTMPGLVPKTEAAVSAYAEAYDTRVCDEVRRLLFALYWRLGADIGSPSVLRTPLAGPILRAGSNSESLRASGYAVSMDRGPITTGAHRRIRSWRSEWKGLGGSNLPIVLSDGATLVGVDALRPLGKEIGYTGAEVDPELDDPRRYPEVSVHPSRSWVSQIGGRWRNVYKPPGAR